MNCVTRACDIWIVSATIDSATPGAATYPGVGTIWLAEKASEQDSISQPLHTSTDRRRVIESTHRMRRPNTLKWNMPAQVIGPNAEPLEFALHLTRPRIATCGLPRIPGLIFAVVIHARLLILARSARFASRLEPRRVQLRNNAAARFGALASHIKAPADASARDEGRA